MSFEWSDAAVEHLKELWKDGLSCSQIARAMGGGLSRCAVAGKVARLHLAPRGRTRTVPSHIPRERSAPKPRPRPHAAPEEMAPEPIGPLESSAPHGTCQWPHGDIGEPGWRMCGPVGFPWCDFHKRRAHQ